jgi:hypothetical protein
LLGPPSRGGDPADDQRNRDAKNQIDEIGLAKAEGIRRRDEEEVEAQERKDDGRMPGPTPAYQTVAPTASRNGVNVALKCVRKKAAPVAIATDRTAML